jgi:hypothetical protein
MKVYTESSPKPPLRSVCPHKETRYQGGGYTVCLACGALFLKVLP